MLRATLLALLCAAVAAVAGGCGSQAGAGGDDPASMVPAGVPVYFEATVRPEGEQRDDALSAAGKLLRTPDPAAKLRELVDKELAEDRPGTSYERDIAPWLGQKAGVWVSGLDQTEPTAAAIIATTDADAARDALQRLARAGGSGNRSRSYKGVAYTLTHDDTAVGMVGDWVVSGDEAGFRRTVDGRDGEHLDGEQRYSDAIDKLEDDRLGHFYVEPRGLIDAAAKQDPAGAAQLRQLKSFFPFDKLGPVTGAFTADGEGMALDTVLREVPKGPLRNLAELSAGSGSDLLGELPGDAWGAFASPHFGETLQELFSSFAGALGGAALTAQVKQSTGLDLQADLLDWMGDLGGFVRGTTEANVDGALVITTRDDARAASAFGKLAGLLGRQDGTTVKPVALPGAESAFEVTETDASGPFYLARAEGKVVGAYGKKAAVAALQPEAKLADSPAFEQAKNVLGEDTTPSFLLALQPALRLRDAVGDRDADFDRVRPYLETISVFAAGGRLDGDDVHSRLAAAFR
jgi:Protein of unknown function (DUF3352)